MSEPKLISPMLDKFVMGGPISDHHGVRCCPAMEKDSDNKYIVKIVSVPASRTQLDALLLSGAYSTQDDALAYFKTLADGVIDEINTLNKLSQLGGFLGFDDMQLEPADDGTGYDIYMLIPYKRSLTRHFTKQPMTHLGALNLGLDMCACLAACRRSGYLYVDLKPNNIFVTTDNEYRIGDLGFLRLDSLKYASLPDKYRSQYTAPEIKDAFSSLNDTIDIYALGLIMYQAYNDGNLPFTGDIAPDEAFAAPAYADYEIAEIILKACAPNPADRWQDPIEMGQALVSYMQRNGANNIPIVPPPVEETLPEEESQDVPATEDQIVDALKLEDEETAKDTADETSGSIETDDELNEIATLLKSEDETAPSESDSELEYNEVSDEVSDILTQVDELAAHPVPDPVVAPDPVEIPMPDPIAPEVEEPETEEPSEEGCEEAAATSGEEEAAPIESTEAEKPKKQARRHWLRNTILIVMLLAVLAAGVYYYAHYYLQPIESIQLAGEEDTLTVYVDSKVDETLLRVICADPHGNQITAIVEGGKAVFNNLVPDTAYTVKVITESFHKLTGDTATAYSTPIQTNIVQFGAITGAESGSAILSFTIDGPDSDQWSVVISADGEEERRETFTSHMATITGLTIGNEYTFRLEPQEALFVAGQEEITFTAAELVYAEDLQVSSCVNNTLTAHWKTPDGATVENWTVRCYNDNYNETIITAENTAVFDGLDHTQSFTVEVTAASMSVNQRVFVPENSVTVTDFTVNDATPSELALSWNASSDIPKNGWQLTCTIDDAELFNTITCEENAAYIPYQLPGATYSFTLRDSEGSIALGTPVTYIAPMQESFSCTYGGYSVSSSDMSFSMCKRPSWKYWDRYDLDADDYTNEFTAGAKAGFLIRLNAEYGYSDDVIHITFAVRNSEGKLINISEVKDEWTDLWYRSYCELDIPELPSAVGEYTMDIFFNDALVHQQTFTIVE